MRTRKSTNWWLLALVIAAVPAAVGGVSVQDIARLQGKLQALDPLAVLGRGYSITRDAAGAVVRSIRSVAAGERLTTQLADGRFDAEVKAVIPEREVGDG